MDEFNPRGLYDIYRVKIKMRDKLCGGKPKNLNILETHVKIKTGFDDQQTKAQIAELRETAPKITEEDLQEQIEQSASGFQEDEHGLFISNYNLKAMFKESCTMLGIYSKRLGSKQILQHGFEIKLPEDLQKAYGVTRDDRIYLGRDKPDGYDDNVVHAMTPKGKITSIKRVDYVMGVTLEFEIWVFATHALEKRNVNEEILRGMLVFSQENGLGAERSQGRGKHNVVSFQALERGANPFAKSIDPAAGEVPAKKGRKGKAAVNGAIEQPEEQTFPE